MTQLKLPFEDLLKGLFTDEEKEQLRKELEAMEAEERDTDETTEDE